MLHQTFHCSENWDTMQVTPQGRFCGVCQKNVFDFTNKSNEEILDLLKTTGKSFCGRTTTSQVQDFNQYNIQRQIKAQTALFLLGLLLVGCEPAKTQEVHKVQEVQQTITREDEMMLSITDVLLSIPPPLEISNLLQELNKNKIAFKQINLLPIKDLTHLTPEQLSFLYGQYAVNVWYAHLFQKMELVEKHQTQLKIIEQKLGIQDLIPHEDFTRLLNSKNELDSINNTAQIVLERIAFQQAENKTNHYSINILAGGFIEATYLLSMLYEQIPNEKLKERIGEQKLTLEQLNLLTEIFKDKMFYYKDFLALQEQYKKVEIIVKREPCKVPQGVDMGVFKDEISVEVKISPQDFQEIREKTKTLRQKYIEQ